MKCRLPASSNHEQDDKVKKALFLNIGGEFALEVFNLHKLPNVASFNDVFKAFDEHFKPISNEVFERYKFFQLRQDEAESIENFVSRIKKQAEFCQFEDRNIPRDIFVIGERILLTCVNLENLLNQLEPTLVLRHHLSSLKQALFHSHTKVVQVALKQLIRLGSDKKLIEKLSEDTEVVLGVIENLAHKDQTVACDCVKVLLLLSSTTKSLMHLLCPDVANVFKTIMTYVAARLLVYEFILQLSLNSQLGLEKSHTCGILEDIINDFKKKESYLTTVHYQQLSMLAATNHGHNYLVKYDAIDTVSKLCPATPCENTAHLITVIPVNSPLT